MVLVVETQHGAKIYTLRMTQDWLQQHPEIQTINAGGASTVAIKQLISQINYSNTGRLYVTFKREAGVSNLAGLTWQETIRTLDRYNCNSLLKRSEMKETRGKRSRLSNAENIIKLLHEKDELL